MVAVFALDHSQQCKFLNAIAEVLTGMPSSRALGMPFRDVVWRDNPLPFEDTGLGRILTAGDGGEGEETFIGPDRVRRPMAFRVVPLALGERATIVELVDLSGETGTGRALRESERRLRLAVEATGIGIWDVNAITGARRWSPEFYSILGLPPDVAPDMKTFSDLIHPDDRDWVDELYRAVFESPDAGPYKAEFRIRRANDQVQRWVSTTGRVSFDASCRPMRGIGTLRDITERREAELTLRESEERLRIALAAGRMGTWRWNLASGEQQWDETQFRLFGVDPAQTPSRELFLSALHPDDVAKVDIDVASLPLDNSFLDSEFRVIWPDGEVRWIAAHSLVRYDQHGRPFEMIGVNRDVTEQKKSAAALRISEEHQRLAVEANEVGTWDFDMVTGEHRWSDQFKKLWGLSMDAPCDPAALRPLVGQKDWEMILDRWRAAADPEGDGRVSIEYEIRRADDDARRWCSFAGQIFFDERQRNPLRAVGIMIDATDRKEVEERQRQILREMNHRVKNSLAVVQAIVSQTIQMTPSPKEAFERIQSRLMSVSRTHDFLDRYGSGEASLRKLIDGELEPFADKIPGRVTLDGPVVMLESASTLALGLTFHELAMNSVKYGALSVPEGRLEVSWRVHDGAERPVVDITWIERGGPAVRSPRRAGFGSRLIEGSVRGNLGGSVEIEYAPTGIRTRLSFPLRPTVPVGEP
jgi:PAS domain S-box-containing protein